MGPVLFAMSRLFQVAARPTQQAFLNIPPRRRTRGVSSLPRVSPFPAANSAQAGAKALPSLVRKEMGGASCQRNDSRVPQALRVRVFSDGVCASPSVRLRISGRLADVCAELDRMVEFEESAL